MFFYFLHLAIFDNELCGEWYDLLEYTVVTYDSMKKKNGSKVMDFI